MHLKTILITLASTVSLVTADSYRCDLGRDDAHMLQEPFCCDGYTPQVGSDVNYVGHNCQGNPAVTSDKKCPNGSKVTCCYSIVDNHYCSTHPKFMSEVDGE